jgi:hypothetical protein
LLQTAAGEKALAARSATQHILDLLVAKDNETASSALKCMSNAELLEAPITMWWEDRRAPTSAPEKQSIAEPRGGEFRAVDCRWHH